MPNPSPDVFALHAATVVDTTELAHMCGMSTADVAELVEYGVLVPLESSSPQPRLFSASCVPPLRAATRLRADFDLDLFTVGLLLGYLQRIAELEQHVRSLEAHLPHAPKSQRDGPALWREPHA